MFEQIELLEHLRRKSGLYSSKKGDKFGLFFVPMIPGKAPMKVLAAPKDSEWQHVSVSLPSRCPTWKEMCFIKDLFWHEDETVVQFHPPKSEYINNHSFCLHLWRNCDGHSTPPSILTGIK